MPSRRVYNNSFGTIGALTNAGTTITFQSAPSFATLQAGDHIPLILEPPGASPSGNFEIVYLTAYTAGATTGTIQRGCEGTTAVAHASGVTWVCAPTAYDVMFGKGADAPQAGNLGYDYEFLNPGSSLPAGWSWTNQGGAAYGEAIKGGSVTAPNNGGSDSFAFIKQAAPSGAFTLGAKITIAAGGNSTGALVLSDGTKLLAFGLTQNFLGLVAMNTPTSWNSNSRTSGNPMGNSTLLVYLQIVYHSASSIDFNYSLDGRNWTPFYAGYSGAFLGALAAVGFGVNPNGAAVNLTCEWFRVR